MVDEEDHDQTPQRTPWSTKGVLVEVRETAIAAARKRGQRMGESIEAAVLNQVRLEAEGGVFPPTRPQAPLPRPSPPVLATDIAGVASLPHTHVALAASAKVPADKGLAEEYAALLRDLMRRMCEASQDLT